MRQRAAKRFLGDGGHSTCVREKIWQGSWKILAQRGNWSCLCLTETVEREKRHNVLSSGRLLRQGGVRRACEADLMLREGQG